MSMMVSSVADTCSETSTESDPRENGHPNFQNRQSHANTKHKRSLCRNFTEKGFCPYGKKCQFAHGVQELKCSKSDNNSYKTKMCTSFERNYQCAYGFRCNFIHKKSEDVPPVGVYDLQQGYRQVLYEGKFSRKSRLINLFASSH